MVTKDLGETMETLVTRYREEGGYTIWSLEGYGDSVVGL